MSEDALASALRAQTARALSPCTRGVIPSRNDANVLEPWRVSALLHSHRRRLRGALRLMPDQSSIGRLVVSKKRKVWIAQLEADASLIQARCKLVLSVRHLGPTECE